MVNPWRRCRNCLHSAGTHADSFKPGEEQPGGCLNLENKQHAGDPFDKRCPCPGYLADSRRFKYDAAAKLRDKTFGEMIDYIMEKTRATV